MPSYYSPPYDSPIEDAFAYAITKYLADDVLLEKQVAVSTICGRFVVGFILSSPTISRIGIECDEREKYEIAILLRPPERQLCCRNASPYCIEGFPFFGTHPRVSMS